MLFCRDFKFVVIFFRQICIPKLSEFIKKWFFPGLRVDALKNLILLINSVSYLRSHVRCLPSTHPLVLRIWFQESSNSSCLLLTSLNLFFSSFAPFASNGETSQMNPREPSSHNDVKKERKNKYIFFLRE